MDAHINDDEKDLLRFLHENVKGCGLTFPLHVRTIELGTGRDGDSIRRTASYLEPKGMVGTIAEQYASSTGMLLTITQVYLTGAGEEYVRNLDRGGIGRKVKRVDDALSSVTNTGAFKFTNHKVVIAILMALGIGIVWLGTWLKHQL